MPHPVKETLPQHGSVEIKASYLLWFSTPSPTSHNLQHNKTQLKLQKMVINNYQIQKSKAGTNHIILKLGKKRKKLEEKNKNTPLAVTSFI